MKRTAKLSYVLTAATLIVSLSSCNNWLNPDDDTYATWCTISTNYVLQAGAEYPFYFITDDSLLFCPENHASINDDFEPIDGKRLILYYQLHGTTPEEKEISDQDPVIKYIDIVQMHLVDTDEFIYTAEPDTLGIDRVEPQYLWIAGGAMGTSRYLNLQVSIQGMDPTRHSFSVIYNLNRETPLDDGYYCLELRHDSDNDPLYTNYTTMLSYPLVGACIEEGVKGLKIKVNTINSGLKVFTLDY